MHIVISFDFLKTYKYCVDQIKRFILILGLKEQRTQKWHPHAIQDVNSLFKVKMFYLFIYFYKILTDGL